MTDFDFSDLNELAADLGNVADNAGPFINSAVQVSSVKVKKAAQKTAGKGNKRWRALPSAIDYELKVEAGLDGSSITSEIGYNKDKDPGKLGNIREFGTPRVAPHNDLQIALAANVEDFKHGLEQALLDAEKKAGL